MAKASLPPAFSTKKGSASFSLSGVDGRCLAASWFRVTSAGIESGLGGHVPDTQRQLIAQPQGLLRLARRI